MPDTAENGAPIPTRERYEFHTPRGTYTCGGCGGVVGGNVADVRQHEAFHDALARVIPPGVDQ